MTDIETQVIDAITRLIADTDSSAVVDDRYNPVPAKFPHISVYQISSINPSQYQDDQNRELYTSVQFEVQVETNDRYKKTSAKYFASIIDDEMQSLGFIRTFSSPVPNVDRTIYRIVLRYSAVVMNPTYGGTENQINLYHR